MFGVNCLLEDGGKCKLCKCASARLKANRRLEAVILCVD